MHPSVKKITEDYFNTLNVEAKTLTSWFFCDNEIDVNECAKLVMQNIKKATSPSLWWFHANDEILPNVGDLNIITNWNGEAQCIIETTKVSIVPFNEITEEYAALEGEGDKTLEYWKQVHRPYYQRELENTCYTPREDMPIVCEVFKVVFTPD